MSVNNDASAEFNTGTGDILDPGSTTTAFPAQLFTTSITGASTWSSENKEAFIAEWKKFRKDFLGILLKDDYEPIKNFKMTRTMNPSTKRTTVKIEIEYEPASEPKDKIRTAL